jgi:hypothetical protein
MATCLHCGGPARVSDSRALPIAGGWTQYRVSICETCGPRSQEIRDTGRAIKTTIPHEPRDPRHCPHCNGRLPLSQSKK